MTQYKMTVNRTGNLFYSKLGEGNKPFRVRFKSFQQEVFQNRDLIQNLDKMQTNYNLFKYGRSKTRKNMLPNYAQQQMPKVYKNMRDRSKDSDDLKTRLKSMKQTRKSIFQRIKSLKQ